MARLSTYLLFDGTCRKALSFYHSVFGGTLELTSVGDSPMGPAFPIYLHDRIVHGRLTIGERYIPASDFLAHDEEPVRGNMNCMYVDFGTAESIGDIFEKLSKGGTITDPFSKQPFGWYGRIIDAFGVIWMFHADAT